MHTSTHNYHQAKQVFHGFLAYDESQEGLRPAVLVAHDWTGRNDFACLKAKELAEMGYLGFALDMYGQAQLGETTEEKQALMTPLIQDRSLLRERLRAALKAVSALDRVDQNRIAIIGFCFGGLCALDLARSGAPIKGAVSFHGQLNKPELKPEPISAKILVLHGYDDPMVRPESVQGFCKEMDEAKVDWQVHMYGHVEHAFTNPKAHDKNLGLVYNALASKRAWKAMADFLQEIFCNSPRHPERSDGSPAAGT